MLPVFSDNLEKEKKPDECQGRANRIRLHHEKFRHYFCRKPEDRLRGEFVVPGERSRYRPDFDGKAGRLLAQAKTFNNLAVPIRVATVEIVQQTAALIDHHNQSAARCMIFHVGLEMRRQIVDPLAEKRDLHFGRARVLNVGPELFDQRCFRCAQVPFLVVP